jgi:hypothetical protein
MNPTEKFREITAFLTEGVSTHAEATSFLKKGHPTSAPPRIYMSHFSPAHDAEEENSEAHSVMSNLTNEFNLRFPPQR